MPSQLCIVELDHQWDESDQEVQEFKHVDRDAIMTHIILPTLRNTLLTIFSQQLGQKHKSIGKNMCKGGLRISGLDPCQFSILNGRSLLWEIKMKENSAPPPPRNIS